MYPDGTESRLEYDAAGRESVHIDGNGNRTTYGYDAAGRRTQVLDVLGNLTEFAFDSSGNQTSMTDAKGNTITFEYDANNRKTRTVFPDSTAINMTYNAMGLKISEADQAGHTTLMEYDALGNLTKIVDALGGQTSYTYDEIGNQLTESDANGHTTRWTYNNMGQVSSRTLPMGMTENFIYDANASVLSHSDFNGQTTSYSYDVNNRMVRKTYPNGSFVAYSYLPTGQRASVTDSRGTTTYIYDDRDRLIRFVVPNGAVILYAYDAIGSRSAMTTPVGATTYVLDALSRITSVTDPDGGVTTYAYDAVGNRTRQIYPNGTRAEYTYDALNRLTSLTNRRADDTILSSFVYTLGPTGNRTRVVEQNRIVDYRYDDLYRLTQEHVIDSGGTTTTTDYSYDATANRLSKSINGTASTYNYDANDRLLDGEGSSHTYDANGNLISQSTTDSTSLYEYDFENHLILATLTTGNMTNTVGYAYDPDGVRVQTLMNGVNSINYLVDANQPLEQVVLETTGSDSILASYVYGDDLISMKRGSTFYYLYDGQMSVRQLSDGASAVTDSYTYDAFGVTVETVGNTPNAYLYTGEQYDPNLGFYYLRARYYHPGVGRLVGLDPTLGNPYDPLSLHKYVYAHADPINNADPSGLFSLPMQIALVGGMLGDIISVAGLSAASLVTQGVFVAATAAAAACAVAGAVSVSTSIGSGNPCDVTNFNILYVGPFMPETRDHIADAIGLNNRPSILHRRQPTGNRRWYRNVQPCKGNITAQSGKSCDEYPFFSTEEGGEGASLRLVSAFEQLWLQGVHVGMFYSVCNVVPGDPIKKTFAVVPTNEWLPLPWLCR